MLNNHISKVIRKDLINGHYIYIGPTNHQALKFVHKAYQKQSLGSVFIFMMQQPNKNGASYNNDYDDLEPEDFFNQYTFDVEMYRTNHGLILLGTSGRRNENHPAKLQDHTGYVVVPEKKHDALETQLCSRGQEEYGVDPDEIDQNDNIRVLAYYLLDHHNLYWNANQQEFRVHDRHLINSFLPPTCAPNKRIRHIKQQWLLSAMIATIRPVFKRFGYKFMNQWKPTYGEISPLAEQIDLFHPNKSTRSKALLSINPSSFIHQLAAVSNNRVFSVESHYVHTADQFEDNYYKTDRSNKAHTQNTFTITPNHNCNLDEFDNFSNLDDGFWGTYQYGEWGSHGEPDRSQIYVSTLFDESTYYDPALIREHPYEDVIIENRSEFMYYAHLIQKAYPNGASYNAVQIGDHLWDVVFQGNVPEYANEFPAAHLTEAHLALFSDGQHSFEVKSDQPKAITFGDARSLKYDIIEHSDLRPIYNNDPNRYMDPDDDNVYDNPIVIRKDLYALLSSHDTNNARQTMHNWLTDNKGYRSFIANI